MVLPVLVNLNKHSNLHSCDQCNQRRRRCDRKLPNCSQCQFREVHCTYNRPLKRCHVLNRETPASLPSSNKTTKLIIIPFDKNLKFNAKKTQFQLTLSQISDKLLSGIAIDKIASDWPYTIGGFIDYLKGSNFNKFPPIYIAKPCLAPCLPASSVWIKQPTPIPFHCFAGNSLETTRIVDLKSVLDRALTLYLKVVNPFNPLFISSLFPLRPRSKLLMTSIWLSGLHHMENKGTLELKVQNELKMQLQNVTFSSLPKTLDSLQFVLVMLVGMRGYSGIDSTVRLCQNLLTRLSYLLGTHVQYQKPNLLQLERRLAYNLASTTDTTRGWGLQLPYLRTIDHTYPYSSTSLMLQSYHSCAKSQPQEQSWELGSIYYSSFLFDNIPSLFHLHLLHNNLTKGSLLTLTELKREVQLNIEQSLSISTTFIRSWHQMQFEFELDNDPESSSEIYVNGSLMYTRVLCYALASLVPMAEADPQLSPIPNSNSSTFIVLDWAFQVVAASLQFPTSRPIFEGRIFLTTTALSFILRHIDLHPNQDHAKLTLKKGYLHLQSLTRHVGLHSHVLDNLCLLRKLSQDLNRTQLLPPLP